MDETIAGLFAEALTDDDRGGVARDALRSRGDRAVFTYAKKWLRAEESARRACAADVLARMDPSMASTEERWKVVHGCLKKERSTHVIEACLGALGAMDASKALPIARRYLTSPDDTLRIAVARVLGQNDDDASFATLIELTRDRSEEVREWATFAVGSLSMRDSIALRDALAARLDDASHDTRQEATAALASRRDARAIPPLLAEWTRKKDASASVLVDNTCKLLGLERAPECWTPRDYIAALEKLRA